MTVAGCPHFSSVLEYRRTSGRWASLQFAARSFTALHRSKAGALDYELRSDATPREKILADLDGIEAQETTDVDVRQTRAAEIVHVSNRAAQKRCHVVHRPEAFESLGDFGGGFHAHRVASTHVTLAERPNVGSTRQSIRKHSVTAVRAETLCYSFAFFRSSSPVIPNASAIWTTDAILAICSARSTRPMKFRLKFDFSASWS